jgi:hypothetical protein
MKRSSGGRPPKFDEPSRPITLTLPERTIADLRRIHADRGRAIVKLTKWALRLEESDPPLVEVIEMAASIGLLVVGPSASLRRISFLHMVEVAPARFLLGLAPGNDFLSLEIAIQDLLEEGPEDEGERKMLSQLLENVKTMRKGDLLSMAEFVFVRLDPQRER